MRFEKITSKNFDKYYALLEDDFCFEERKTKAGEFKSISNKQYNPCLVYDDDKLIGYFCYWEYDNFLYCEHFAMLKELRGQGYGSKFLKWYLNSIKKPFILEVEDPIDDLTKNRVKFYEKLGLVLNDFEYYQPSYHDGSDSVPMKIMSYKTPLSKAEFNEYFKIMLKTVYAKNLVEEKAI